MVSEEILRQLAALDIAHETFFYRTAAGAEVDLVIEGDFGLIPFEIRHSGRVSGRDLRSLRGFMQDHDCRLGIVVNNDEAPRLYDETIVGIPFAWL